MDTTQNGNVKKGGNGGKKADHIDVERAVGEGMDTPPQIPESVDDFRARAVKLWNQLAEMMKERPAQVLSAVASLSFFAGVAVGRFGRRRG